MDFLKFRGRGAILKFGGGAIVVHWLSLSEGGKLPPLTPPNKIPAIHVHAEAYLSLCVWIIVEFDLCLKFHSPLGHVHVYDGINYYHFLIMLLHELNSSICVHVVTPVS